MQPRQRQSRGSGVAATSRKRTGVPPPSGSPRDYATAAASPSLTLTPRGTHQLGGWTTYEQPTRGSGPRGERRGQPSGRGGGGGEGGGTFQWYVEQAGGLSAKWLAFYGSASGLPSIPLDAAGSPPKILPNAQQGPGGGGTVAYCMTVVYADGVPVIPELYMEVIENLHPQGGSSVTVEYKFHFSMFDCFTKKFFGNTFISDSAEGNNIGNLERVVYNQSVYFHSSIIDENCVAILEYVVQVKLDSVVIKEYSVGWSILPVFGDPTRLADKSSLPKGQVQFSDAIYAGTPRALMFVVSNKGIDNLRSQLNPLLGSKAFYNLCLASKFSPAICFIRENEPIGSNSVIPGLRRVLKKYKEPPKNFQPTPYSHCDILRTPLFPPILVPTTELAIGTIEAILPPNFDDELIEAIQQHRLHVFGLQENDGQIVSIIEKRVVVGVHNGHTFVAPPEKCVLYNRGGGGLWYDQCIMFPYFVAHPLYKMNLEYTDKRCCNDIFFLFIGYSPDKKNAPQFHSLILSFRFWRYPPVYTCKLFLKQPSTQNNNLNEAVHVLFPDEMNQENPGFLTHYWGQGKQFLDYLHEKFLQIDVWDGDALFYLGSCHIELKYLLREAAPAIQRTQCYNITNFEKAGPEETQHVVCNGFLHLRMANIGSSTNRSGILNPPTEKTHILQQPPTQPQSTEMVTASELRDISNELAVLLQQVRNKTPPPLPTSPIFAKQQVNGTELLQRQKARIQLIQQKLGKLENLESTLQRERELLLIQSYRENAKRDTIANHLRKYPSSSHTIFPTFGSVSFFELLFTNPYNEEHTFSFPVGTPELHTVTDEQEHISLRRVFHVEASMPTKPLLEGNKVLLGPRESIYVPFKFQSWKCGYLVPSDFLQQNAGTNLMVGYFTPTGVAQPDEPITKQNVNISICNNRGYVLGCVNVIIEPQPYVVDHTFHFFGIENEMFTQSIAIVSKYDTFNKTTSPKYARFSTTLVRYTVQKPLKETEDQRVVFTVKCGASPSTIHFYAVIYSDPQLLCMSECWLIFVHSKRRYDLTAQVGQTTQGTLPHGVFGPSSTSAYCFSSHQEVAVVDPTVVLNMGQTNEIFCAITPRKPGILESHIHLVDATTSQLLFAWIVHATATAPRVTRKCQLVVNTDRTVPKRLVYQNPSSHPKTLLLHTNQPEFLSFKDDTLELTGQEKKAIIMQFHIPPNSNVRTLLVFFNDAETGETVDCLQISITQA
ncbi:nephronophthisis 4 [Pelomyxa schiedti]|nr:nephronophthisis 4 [Pelomyxa schiedti]